MLKGKHTHVGHLNAHTVLLFEGPKIRRFDLNVASILGSDDGQAKVVTFRSNEIGYRIENDDGCGLVNKHLQ